MGARITGLDALLAMLQRAAGQQRIAKPAAKRVPVNQMPPGTAVQPWRKK